LSKVKRTLIADGSTYRIECAIDSNRNSPAKEFLDELKAGVRDTNPLKLPKDAQISTYSEFLESCEEFAEFGDFDCPKSQQHKWYNQLQDGIWELKKGELRLSFFDTDGQGGFEPKIQSKNYWDFVPELPDFDPFIRLAHGFPKPASQRKTKESDMNLAEKIRLEDVNHDF
jgi:hypothetical protein